MPRLASGPGDPEGAAPSTRPFPGPPGAIFPVEPKSLGGGSATDSSCRAPAARRASMGCSPCWGSVPRRSTPATSPPHRPGCSARTIRTRTSRFGTGRPRGHPPRPPVRPLWRVPLRRPRRDGPPPPPWAPTARAATCPRSPARSPAGSAARCVAATSMGGPRPPPRSARPHLRSGRSPVARRSSSRPGSAGRTSPVRNARRPCATAVRGSSPAASAGSDARSPESPAH